VIAFFFFSLLIVASRTDLEKMVIPQLISLWPIPLIFLANLFFRQNRISLKLSIIGSLFGYLFLFVTNIFYRLARKKDGLGEGDMELSALVGSFLGIAGVLRTIMIAAISGIFAAIIYFFLARQGQNKKRKGVTEKKQLSETTSISNLMNTALPFGPFIALGAFVSYLFNLF
jgi:leader peptidase (prepilin peptidase)/N-methyltransferase